MENGPWESALASATSSLQATPEAPSSCVSVGFGFLHPRKVSKQLRVSVVRNLLSSAPLPQGLSQAATAVSAGAVVSSEGR